MPSSIRILIRPFAALALLVGAFCGTPAVHADAERPNIVFLLVDDLRWDMLGHMGAPIETPAIDRLAAEGVRFENAFVVTSLCSPSRATILTGVYPQIHRVFGNSDDLDPVQLPTVAQLLQQHGYETAMIGKWHMGVSSAPRPGWDRWFGLPGHGEYEDPLINDDGTIVQRLGYNTDILTDEAVRFINENRGRPFYLHLGYKGVHEPFLAAPRHRGLHDDVIWPVRGNANGAWGELRRAYADTLLAIEESVARLDAALEEAGIRDNTVVVFTSDNGYMFGEHERLDKRVFFEESIRVPLIVRYPGATPPGIHPSEQVLNLDLAPTLLELAGAPVPQHMQGRSLVKLLRGKRVPWRRDWLYAYQREIEWPQVSTLVTLRTGRYKYTEFPLGPDMFCYFSGQPMLFDIGRDPLELHDVVDDPDYEDVREQLAARLAAVMSETGFESRQLDMATVQAHLRWLVGISPFMARQLALYYPHGFRGWESLVCPDGTRW